MRKIRSLLILCIIFPVPLLSQPWDLQVFVDHMPDQRVFLASVKGSDQTIEDSTLSSNGSFVFRFTEKAPRGMYRLLLGSSRPKDYFGRQTKGFDVIFDRENIRLSTDYASPVEHMKVILSEENRIYFDFLRTRSTYTSKFNALYHLLNLYSKDEPFYAEVAGEFVNVQHELTDSLMVLSHQLPGTFVSSLIGMYPEPVYDPMGYEQLDAFMQKHYFDLVRFNDPDLINSDVYTKLIINYLGFYSDRSAGKEEQEKLFMPAIDTIMNAAGRNKQVYDFVLNFLVDGFERLKMEDVLVYIADNYLEGACSTDSEKLMQERLEGYKKMAIGQRVGDIVLTGVNGKPERLSNVKGDHILLVFWASWCPHCEDLMPRLKKWYEEQAPGDRPGIYTVSIDTSKSDWDEYLMKNDLPWVNVIEPHGWDGKVARRFNIYATPTMFLLDRKHKILAKPVSFREFKKAYADIPREAE